MPTSGDGARGHRHVSPLHRAALASPDDGLDRLPDRSQRQRGAGPLPTVRRCASAEKRDPHGAGAGCCVCWARSRPEPAASVSCCMEGFSPLEQGGKLPRMHLDECLSWTSVQADGAATRPSGGAEGLRRAKIACKAVRQRPGGRACGSLLLRRGGAGTPPHQASGMEPPSCSRSCTGWRL